MTFCRFLRFFVDCQCFEGGELGVFGWKLLVVGSLGENIR